MSFETSVLSFAEAPLDLNSYFIKHRASTFFVRISGDAMAGIGIMNNDVLVVDRSLIVKSQDLVVVEYNNEFLIRRMVKKEKHYCLNAENSIYKPIIIEDGDELKIFGVVTASFRNYD